MDAKLQEALNQSKFSQTLALQIRQAYDKFIANCTFGYSGGIFVATPELILWMCAVITENKMKKSDPDANSLLLDKNKKPVVVNILEFGKKVEDVHTDALNAYYAEYTAITKSRNIKTLVKLDETAKA